MLFIFASRKDLELMTTLPLNCPGFELGFVQELDDRSQWAIAGVGPPCPVSAKYLVSYEREAAFA